MIIWKDNLRSFALIIEYSGDTGKGDPHLDEEKWKKTKLESQTLPLQNTPKELPEHKSNLAEDAGLRHLANANSDKDVTNLNLPVKEKKKKRMRSLCSFCVGSILLCLISDNCSRD